MSSYHPESTTAQCKKQRVESYLRSEHRETDGDLYIKSRDVAAATELSAKQIGLLIAQLQRGTTSLSIERWAYSNSTTWRIVDS